jgi:hypothetical protein
MGNGELNRGATWRLIGAALLLAVSCATGALLTLSADADARGAATGAVPAAGAPSPAPRAAADQSASRPVQDDPVIAPDPHESADNNVSFPADI